MRDKERQPLRVAWQLRASNGRFLPQSQRREELSSSHFSRSLFGCRWTLQRLSDGMLQKVQQQGEEKIEKRRRGAGSEEGRARRPFATPLQAPLAFGSKESTQSSSTKLRTKAKALSIIRRRSLQSRTAANRAGARDGSGDIQASSFDGSSPGRTPQAAVLSSSNHRERLCQLFEPTVGIGSNMSAVGTTEILSYRAGSLSSDAPSLLTRSTTESADSQASSLAYIARDRRMDLRLFRHRPALFAVQNATSNITSSSSKRSSSTRPSPEIIEDSRDRLLTKNVTSDRSRSLSPD